MPFDRRTAIKTRLERYRLIEQQLGAEPDAASNAELTRLRRIIADLETQLEELARK
jgi:hypothetical protein